MTAWIVNYCQAHPPKSLVDAAVALVNELGTKW
jgi:hypothetical protein